MRATTTAPRSAARGPSRTLRLERNMARAPIWAPRVGVPVQLAMEWHPAPLNGALLLMRELRGVLSPIDLLTFTNLCTAYLERRPADRRIAASLGQVARWMGAESVGGEQRRAARESLARLASIFLEGTLRRPGRGGGIWVGGWHLVDQYLIPERSRRVGSITLGEPLAELLDAGSVVMLDQAILERLVRTSPMAARLWIWLEAESLSEVTRFALFDAPPGEPSRQRANAAIADLLRLGQARRRQTVARVREACQAITEADERYRLTVEGAREAGMWNLTAARAEAPAEGAPGRATSVTLGGDQRDAGRATSVTLGGDQRDADPDYGPRSDGPSPERGSRATSVTPAGPVVVSLVDSLVGVLSSSGARARPEGAAPDESRVRRAAALLDRQDLPDAVRRQLVERYGGESPA